MYTFSPNTKIESAKVNSNFAEVSALAGGWATNSDTPSYVQGNGNGEFKLRITGVDRTTVYYAGHKGKVTRSGSIATQSLDLESGSSQYASDSSLTGISFTDDYTVEALVKPESRTLGTVLSRWDGGTNGWRVIINQIGQILIQGVSGGTTDYATSNQSVPIGEWSHIAATLDMSAGTATIYINGASVPLAYTNGAGTSLAQGTANLQLGAANSTDFFDGKIAEVRLWNAVRTAAQIRDNAGKHLTGSETNLIGYWKLDNSYNDSTSNANHLSASGSPVFSTDHLFSSTEHFVITKSEYTGGNTDLTVLMPFGSAMPNETLSNFYYSAARSPSGFPSDRTKWQVSAEFHTNFLQNTPTSGTWYNVGHQISVPLGGWDISYQGRFYVSRGTSGGVTVAGTLSDANNTASDNNMTSKAEDVLGAAGAIIMNSSKKRGLQLLSQTTYYLNIMTDTASMGNIYMLGDTGSTKIIAECAYI